MDWEAWLRAAAERPSDNEDSQRKATEKQIKDALAAYGPLDGRPYRVYAKGSYANNTNVRLNYDVDVAVEYTGYFYYDLEFELAGKDKEDADIIGSDDPYTRAEFKADILMALEVAFGERAVTPGKIAYRVREKKTTLPADVVPCWEYRRYERVVNGEPSYEQGSRVYPSGGAGYKNNFPAQQLENGIAKNNSTGRRYKRMVRCLKKLQTRMVAEGLVEEELPSYLSECLVYNVPNDGFNNWTYLADMRHVLMHIFNETLPNGDWNDWEEVHGLNYLFRGKRSWSRGQVHEVASEAWDYLGL